jgi:hypothetical protein
VATVGDPVLLLVPLATAVFGILALLGAGAPTSAACAATRGCATTVLVPVVSLPPFDAYQDAGVVQLTASATVWIWVARLLAVCVRAAVFGTIAHLALQRAHGRAPSLRVATGAVGARYRSLLVLELASFGLFGVPLVLGQGSVILPGRQVSQLGALVGQVLLMNAFLAALGDRSVGGAVVTGFRWVRRRPLGHLAVAVAAAAATNGVFWLARSGEAGPERPATLAAFALTHAFVSAAFLVAFARRFALLYDGAPGRKGRRRAKTPQVKERKGSPDGRARRTRVPKASGLDQ